MLVYEVKFQDGQWRTLYNGVALFSFATKQEAVSRLDDLAYSGSRLKKDVEIRIYNEAGDLTERYSALDYDI